MSSGMEDLKRRLEVILERPLATAVDESQQRRVESEAMQLAERRAKVSAASGQLITAALSLAGELIGEGPDQPSTESVTRLANSLSQCVNRDSPEPDSTDHQSSRR